MTGPCPWSSRPRPRYRWRPSGARGGPPRATASSSRPPAAAKRSTWSTPATEPNPASRRTRTSPTASPRSPRRPSPPPSTRPPTSSTGLLMNETGRRVREQYADTGGFTDHVFAACSILGYTFVPRIRDLPSKRLYVFERAGVPKQLRPLVGGKFAPSRKQPDFVTEVLRRAYTNKTITPLQRPVEFAGRELLTAEEVANLEREAVERNAELLRAAGAADQEVTEEPERRRGRRARLLQQLLAGRGRHVDRPDLHHRRPARRPAPAADPRGPAGRGRAPRGAQRPRPGRYLDRPGSERPLHAVVGGTAHAAGGFFGGS